MAVAQAPIGKVVEAGSLPPWGVGDLPAPPPYTLKNALRVTGAGAIILGISIGSGEWLIGPAVTAQAVIAIENVRLFKELQARNAELTDALARETSTSEILRVISRSPTDVQPVFDAIVESAVRLCGGLFGIVHRFDGEVIDLAAHHNLNPEGLVAYRAVYPW